MQVVEGAHGEISHVVVSIFAAAKGLFALIECTDDGVKSAFNGNFLAYRVLGTKELFGGVVSENNPVGGASIFIVGEQTSCRQAEIGHVADLGRRTLENG